MVIDANVLENLVTAKDEQQVVYGTIRGLTKLKMPVDEQGQPNKENKEFDVYLVILPGNVTGYCHVNNLRYTPLNPRDYRLHVGRREPFLITALSTEEQVAIVSCVDALRKQAADLWAALEHMTDEEIMEQEYDVDIIHYNNQKRMIYGFLSGHVVSMLPRDWSWATDRGLLDVQPGERIKAKIVSINRETRVLRISRRAVLQDPFEFLTTLNVGDAVAGKVMAITEGVGIFVRIANGIDVIAYAPRSIEKPVLGDVVTGEVRSIDAEKRQARIRILGYPNGKKRVEDLGAFLYGE